MRPCPGLRVARDWPRFSVVCYWCGEDAAGRSSVVEMVYVGCRTRIGAPAQCLAWGSWKGCAEWLSLVSGRPGRGPDGCEQTRVFACGVMDAGTGAGK